MRQRKRKKRRKLSAEERKKRALTRSYRKQIRETFQNAGFLCIASREIPVVVRDRSSDIDALFCYENIAVLVEDSMATADHLSDHVKAKAAWCEYASGEMEDLLEALHAALPEFRKYVRRIKKYRLDEFHIVFIYAHRYNLDEKYRKRYADTMRFMSYPELQYFRNLAATIGKSARFEILKFAGLELAQVGPPRSSNETSNYEGFLVSEAPSGFPPGHKLVSFLADPRSLLERAYVLRADSWRDGDCLYQRLLVKPKISGMRAYLSDTGRVFVNNIIVTLPYDTRVTERGNGQHINKHIRSINVELPRRFSTIGIVDGQHRVFAYHEGTDEAEKEIAVLRDKQHLLVTGIIYPKQILETAKEQFEARMFLEINDKQTRVKSNLKQSIERLLSPFSALAIAKAVVERLSTTGPLSDLLEVHFFDRGKIKTASIVSYGLRHIVRPDGNHSLLSTWGGSQKAIKKKSRLALNDYVDHCADEINLLLGAFRNAVGQNLWVADRSKSRVLTTTTINGLIYCMRCLLENGKTGDFDYYSDGFARMTIDFRPKKFPYKSSHWKALGTDLYKQCFD